MISRGGGGQQEIVFWTQQGRRAHELRGLTAYTKHTQAQSKQSYSLVVGCGGIKYLPGLRINWYLIASRKAASDFVNCVTSGISTVV